MPVLSYLHQLFNAEHCQTYIHTLRWKERPLQCPRCQSQDVDPWGTYHDRPGCKRSWCNGCKRTFNDLTNTLLHQSKRSLAYWILATFLLCLSCASRRIARELGSIAVRAIAGAGGCGIRPCPTKSIAGWQARWKRMTSITLPARRAEPSRVAPSLWGVDRVVVARSVSPAGAMTTKIPRRSWRGSAARGRSSSTRPEIAPCRRSRRPRT